MHSDNNQITQKSDTKKVINTLHGDSVNGDLNYSTIVSSWVAGALSAIT